MKNEMDPSLKPNKEALKKFNEILRHFTNDCTVEQRIGLLMGASLGEITSNIIRGLSDDFHLNSVQTKYLVRHANDIWPADEEQEKIMNDKIFNIMEHLEINIKK